MQTRKASDYLPIGQLVKIPKPISVPISYESNPNGAPVRIGKIVEHLDHGGVCVLLGRKQWDYSNREALKFSKLYAVYAV